MVDDYYNGDEVKAGGIFGTPQPYSAITNAYNTGKILYQEEEKPGVLIGIKIDDLSTIDETFFENTLAWDKEIWDYSLIDIGSKIYPSLK